MSRITIHASMSLQNIGSGINAHNLYSRYDALNNKNNRLSKDKSLSADFRLKQQDTLMNQMNDICKKIEDISRKDRSHKKADYYHDRREQLNSTMDSDEAEQLLRLEKLTSMTADIQQAEKLQEYDAPEDISADIQAQLEDDADSAATPDNQYTEDLLQPVFERKGHYIDQHL